MGLVTLCDTHVHVFDPERYPYAPDRKFTPEAADLGRLVRCLDLAGMGRVVLVQPSVYGTDNRCMLDAMASLPGKAKGIAVVSPQASCGEFDALTEAGVVGARLNMVVHRNDDPVSAMDALQTLDHMLPKSWHIQLHVSLHVLTQMAPALDRSDRVFVLDHLGLPAVSDGTDSPMWQALLARVREGQLRVKLSGPYQSSKAGAPYLDLRPFVETLALASPDALLWGSNWPHTQGVHRDGATDVLHIEPFRPEDPLAWPQACERWLGHTLYERMHRNAAELYGFES